MKAINPCKKRNMGEIIPERMSMLNGRKLDDKLTEKYLGGLETSKK